jgi:hypothetical protein
MSTKSRDYILRKLAPKVAEWVLSEEFIGKEYSIFLCGGRSATALSSRDKIRDEIHSLRSKYNYKVFYPEVLFVNLLHGHTRRDLLSLENLLADSVHAVVLIVESAGALVELGAFSNHEKLARKLVVVVDKIYERDRSFVNLGPIRLLRQKKWGKVIYHSLSGIDYQRLVRLICDSVREVSQTTAVDQSLGNPIYSRHAYLAMAYCFDPISQEELSRAGQYASQSLFDYQATTETVCRSLSGEGLVRITPEKVAVTKAGRNVLVANGFTSHRSFSIQKSLSRLRIEYLNFALRHKFD